MGAPWTQEARRRQSLRMLNRHARQRWERQRDHAPPPPEDEPGIFSEAPPPAPDHAAARARWEQAWTSGVIERFDPETGELIARGHLVRRQVMHAFAAMPPETRGVLFSCAPRPIWITEWVDESHQRAQSARESAPASGRPMIGHA